MSGIVAIFETCGGEAEAGAVEQMARAMEYRGLDGMSCWTQGPVALGHCATYSTAEEREAIQPHASEDGRVRLVLDGYLTNIDALRRELRDRKIVLRNSSDAEIVLRAWELWGRDCPQRLEGEYAFILWDGRSGELFCARDHQGLRPLLYHFDGRRLLLGTDAVAILAALPHRPAPNAGFLTEVLTFQWYSRDETVWSGIMRLPQAHSLQASGSGLRIGQYWQLDTSRRLTYAREDDYAEHYRELLAEAVRSCARTDRPLAVEASGGLDSTALFCMAHRLQDSGTLPAPEVRGYTMAGPPGTPADEIEYVHAVVEELGVPVAEHPYFLPDLEWFAANARQSCDLPLPPNGAISLTEERAIAADGCRACMNGLGGDQWLDGSAYYYLEFLRAGDWRKLARTVRGDIAARGWHWTARALTHFGVSPMLSPGLRSAARRIKALVPHRARPSQALELTAPAAAELRDRRQRYLDSLPSDRQARLKLEKLAHPYWSSMYDMNSRQAALNGLSQRHPMLSRPYIEFMAAVPEHLLLRRGVRKCLHRDALAGILPEKVRLRTSEGTTDQVFHRLSEPMIAQLRSPEGQSLARLIVPQELERTIGEYCSAAIDNRSLLALWPIYVIFTILGISGGASFFQEGDNGQ
ncbi:asparagine synthetase B family protein [Alteraurantiacibacter aquimixticola]|uniref:asparagine synthase (glutamine-hydrolyzing) n=1 Tax=Alteraurantiacibacter aquimixticola TaxID=2489173 RepID=A0A4T3EWM2_9SPHN|nr:asparagine synthase-related protein [Alteraurantiacibacter aquimixticola]TIX48965.1 asparagine synthetase B [Alteraurantiacibacter aquimixticola]